MLALECSNSAGSVCSGDPDAERRLIERSRSSTSIEERGLIGVGSSSLAAFSRTDTQLDGEGRGGEGRGGEGRGGEGKRGDY